MLGVDLVDVARLARALERVPGLRARTFSARELAAAAERGDGAEFLAGRLAAKEATLKALGIGLGSDVPLAEIEVLAAAGGAPRLRLHGRAAALGRERGLAPGHVSISHESGLAVAVVLLSPNVEPAGLP